MLIVAREPPDQVDVAALLAGSDAESATRYPAQSRFGVGLTALQAPACRFFVARLAGAAVGCGGVVIERDGMAEIKRLFVAPAWRGQGVARKILAALEDTARDADVAILRLETGVRSHAALALYRGLGFVERRRFGDYPNDPLSVFMEKAL